jgi:hypothetical protein
LTGKPTNLVQIGRGAAVQVAKARHLDHETGRLNILPESAHHREPTLGREVNDLGSVSVEERVVQQSPAE